MGKIAGRPMLQELVKAAMVESADRVRVTEEARIQSEKTAEEKCAKCGKEKCACMGKTASAGSVQMGTHVEKLASALDFIVGELSKEATNLAGGHNLTEHLVTSPPGVSQATASTPLPDHKGQGVHITPMHPGQQKGLPTERGATQMSNTLNEAPELHHQMMQNNSGKTASVVQMIRTKLASDEHEKKETEGLAKAEKGLAEVEKAHESEPENKGKEASTSLVDYMTSRVKQAEDALNPAKISAGAAVPPDTSAAGQPGGAPVGGKPKGPTGLVSSNESAQHYTKGQSHGPRREELGKYFNEPALSAQHDSTLQAAFKNTGKAGTKLGSAEEVPAPAAASVKTAAARVLLSKLAEGVDLNNGGAAAPGV